VPPPQVEAVRPRHVPQLLPQVREYKEGDDVPAPRQAPLLLGAVSDMLPCQVLPEAQVEARREEEAADAQEAVGADGGAGKDKLGAEPNPEAA